MVQPGEVQLSPSLSRVVVYFRFYFRFSRIGVELWFQSVWTAPSCCFRVFTLNEVIPVALL